MLYNTNVTSNNILCNKNKYICYLIKNKCYIYNNSNIHFSINLEQNIKGIKLYHERFLDDFCIP